MESEINTAQTMPLITQHVVLHPNKRAFSYYDLDAKNWRMDHGEFVIYVGDSSELVPVKQSLPM